MFILVTITHFRYHSSVVFVIPPLSDVAYEKAVSENQTFQPGVFYTGVKLSDLKYSGVGITPGYHFYVAGHKEAFNGVYVAPFLRSSGFVPDIFPGLSYNAGKIKEDIDEDDWEVSGDIDGFTLRTGITVGFGF